MTLASSRWLNGALLGLLIASVAAACGSDDGKKRVQEVTGGAGAGGEAGATPLPSGGSTIVPVGGAGGEPVQVAGGQGGAPPLVTAGEGGTPAVVEMGGAGGTPPDVLPPIDCDPVVFADANLEDAVRTAIDKAGPITAEDIASLSVLNAAGYQVADLAGIECFSEITDLNLGYGGGNSQVTDLSPLRYLKKLEALDLNSDPVQSLEPLGELPNLQRLNLNNTSDSLDFTPLASAPALVRLDLESNTLGNLSPLGQIKTLREVWMTGAAFTAPNTLAVLTQVERLHVGGTQLTDATPLAGLTKLTELTLNSNGPVANFDKLSTLTNLTWLRAENAGLTSITAVASMTKLFHLDLYSNQIVDVSPIQGLLELKELYLNINSITDIAPLANNTGLGTGDTVYLTNNPLDCQTQGAHVTTLITRGATVFSPCN